MGTQKPEKHLEELRSAYRQAQADYDQAQVDYLHADDVWYEAWLVCTEAKQAYEKARPCGK